MHQYLRGMPAKTKEGNTFFFASVWFVLMLAVDSIQSSKTSSQNILLNVIQNFQPEDKSLERIPGRGNGMDKDRKVGKDRIYGRQPVISCDWEQGISWLVEKDQMRKEDLRTWYEGP